MFEYSKFIEAIECLKNEEILKHQREKRGEKERKFANELFVNTMRCHDKDNFNEKKLRFMCQVLYMTELAERKQIDIDSQISILLLYGKLLKLEAQKIINEQY